MDLAQEVLSLRLQAEEQAGGIKLLQQTINDVRKLEKESRIAHTAELNKVTNEMQSAVLRHQEMVKKVRSFLICNFPPL